MAYDPAWDMPQANWLQQGSFESGEIPPAVEPDAGTQICVGPFAREWLPVVLGALDQLRNPSTWLVADDAAMYTTLRRVDKLREIIAVGEGCQLPTMIRLNDSCVLQYSNDGGDTWVDATDWVANFGNCVRADVPPPAPPNPGDDLPAVRACNVAGYLASQILKKAFGQMIADHNTNQKLLDEARNVAAVFANELPWTFGFITAVDVVYPLITDANVALWQGAIDDGLLWSDLTCAIYNAIKVDGYVTAGNMAAMVSNICAIVYFYSAIVDALCSWCTNLQLGDWRQLQLGSALDVVDCSTCQDIGPGTTPWCWTWDFRYASGAPSVIAVNNATYQISWDGTAWVCGFNVTHGRTEGQLLFENGTGSGPTSWDIDYFEVGISAAQPNTNGTITRDAEFHNGASLVFTLGLNDAGVGGYVVSHTFSTPLTIDSCFMKLFADSGDLRFDYIRMRGPDGPPVWGASNCQP